MAFRRRRATRQGGAFFHQTAIGDDRFEHARDLFLKYGEHALPLTDCTSFVVMRELGLKDALTADRHFRTMGFNPLLAG